MTRTMRRGWVLAAAALFVASVVWAWQSLQLSLFDRLGPGPGFFPFWLSLIGAVLSAVVLVQTRAGATEAEGEPILPRGVAAVRVIAILVALAIVASLMTLLGFRVAMALFAGGLLWALGERRWWAIGLFGLAGSFGLFYIFNDKLDVVLPTGVLGF
jgi:putative tricarboxylic transport membrane protein